MYVCLTEKKRLMKKICTIVKVEKEALTSNES